MPRLARRSAGKQVAARAHRLADDLLTVEEQTFRLVGTAFERAVPAAESHLNAGLRAAKQDMVALRGQAAMIGRITDRHRAAADGCRWAVEDLAEQAVQMSLDAILDELVLCERTLNPKRYAGLAVAAVSAVRDGTDVVVKEMLDRYDAQVDTAVFTFTVGIRQQVQFAGQYGDTPEQVAKRLFSPDPVNRLGCSGRGMWWRTPSSLNRDARAVSIGLMNATRTAAMKAFNEIGASRA